MTQAWDPAAYARDARFVPELAEDVLAWLAPRAGERILDLGCGDGALTKKIAASGCEVVGVDSSPAMVEAARAEGLDARVVDGHDLAFDEEFDAVFSNAALHWMKRPERVIAGVHGALKPGGRFVGEMGGHGNIATVAEGLRVALRGRGLEFDDLDPWYFPTDEEYRALLEAAGMQVRACRLIPRPTGLPTDLVGWLRIFARRFTDVLPEGDRESFLQEVSARCAPRLRDPEGRWHVDYVRLRFIATKP